MNQVVKLLTALGMIFSGIGQMLAQYNDFIQKAAPPTQADNVSDVNKTT